MDHSLESMLDRVRACFAGTKKAPVHQHGHPDDWGDELIVPTITSCSSTRACNSIYIWSNRTILKKALKRNRKLPWLQSLYVGTRGWDPASARPSSNRMPAWHPCPSHIANAICSTVLDSPTPWSHRSVRRRGWLQTRSMPFTRQEARKKPCLTNRRERLSRERSEHSQARFFWSGACRKTEIGSRGHGTRMLEDVGFLPRSLLASFRTSTARQDASLGLGRGIQTCLSIRCHRSDDSNRSRASIRSNKKCWASRQDPSTNQNVGFVPSSETNGSDPLLGCRCRDDPSAGRVATPLWKEDRRRPSSLERNAIARRSTRFSLDVPTRRISKPRIGWMRPYVVLGRTSKVGRKGCVAFRGAPSETHRTHSSMEREESTLERQDARGRGETPETIVSNACRSKRTVPDRMAPADLPPGRASNDVARASKRGSVTHDAFRRHRSKNE